MSVLKIAFTDFWPEWNYENFITPILDKHYDIVLDYKNPDVVFSSIFRRMENATPKYPKAKSILFLGENHRPALFKKDYSISFDPQSETNFRLPLWQAYLFLWPNLKELLFTRVNHVEFKRFCSFTVSNGSNMFRNGAFDQLTNYKRVHSYGKIRTNSLELRKRSLGKNWQATYSEFFNEIPHKFALTYENSSYPYYCTEKLMHTFLVGSIPIYWGDPKVEEDWNQEAFINTQRLGSSWIDKVKELDQDDEKFQKMYSKPIFTNEQKDKLIKNMNNFESWLVEVINK